MNLFLKSFLSLGVFVSSSVSYGAEPVSKSFYSLEKGIISVHVLPKLDSESLAQFACTNVNAAKTVEAYKNQYTRGKVFIFSMPCRNKVLDQLNSFNLNNIKVDNHLWQGMFTDSQGFRILKGMSSVSYLTPSNITVSSFEGAMSMDCEYYGITVNKSGVCVGNFTLLMNRVLGNFPAQPKFQTLSAKDISKYNYQVSHTENSASVTLSTEELGAVFNAPTNGILEDIKFTLELEHTEVKQN